MKNIKLHMITVVTFAAMNISVSFGGKADSMDVAKALGILSNTENVELDRVVFNLDSKSNNPNLKKLYISNNQSLGFNLKTIKKVGKRQITAETNQGDAVTCNNILMKEMGENVVQASCTLASTPSKTAQLNLNTLAENLISLTNGLSEASLGNPMVLMKLRLDKKYDSLYKVGKIINSKRSDTEVFQAYDKISGITSKNYPSTGLLCITETLSSKSMGVACYFNGNTKFG